MYAHQILADLDHTKSWYDEVNEVLYKQLYDLIITSHQFYMKSTSDLYSLFPPDTLGERIFMDNSDDLFLHMKTVCLNLTLTRHMVFTEQPF